MRLNVFQEISQSYLDTETHKLLQISIKEIPRFLKQICLDLSEDLNESFKIIADEYDLKEFRKRLSFIEQITDILSNVSSNNTNEWVLPLIKECYEKLTINAKDREIIIVSSYHSVGFAVITDFTNILSQFSTKIGSKNYPKTDLFIIPLEVKHDISSMTLLGHEVGHVYINEYIVKIEEYIRNQFENYVSSRVKGDIALLADYLGKSAQISKHIQEYLCDDFGRLLFGPAFDFSLLKLFCFSRIEDQQSSLSHPPPRIRIEISKLDIQKYQAIDSEFDKGVKYLESYFDAIDSEKYDRTEEDKFCISIASQIFQDANISNQLTIPYLNSTWRLVKTELDSFRPPFESVNSNSPQLITPIAAVLVTTIYFYGKSFYSNDYVKKLEGDEELKFQFVRLKLTEHLQYAISLFDFVKFANSKFGNNEDFAKLELNNTLWNLRGKKIASEASPFVVTPTIDPLAQYSSSAVDLRLGQTFLVNKLNKYTHIEPYSEDFFAEPDRPRAKIREYYDEYYIPIGEDFTLHPHQFILAQTLEYVCIPPDSYALVLGRSSWGRLGLNIATATAVGPGFRGCITLELRNLGETPLTLKVGLRICQLALIPITAISGSHVLYFAGKGKYIGPIKSEIPKIREDVDWKFMKDFLGSL